MFLYKVWKTPPCQLIKKEGFVDMKKLITGQGWGRILDCGSWVTPFSRPNFERSIDSAYLTGVEISKPEAREIFKLLSNSKITDIPFKRFEVCL